MRTKNKYKYPVNISEKTRISSDESPAHIKNLKHSVDFIVEEGTPVKAVMDGIVVDLKSDSNIGGAGKEFEPLGNFIEIEHDNNEYSEYEHLRKDGVLVKAGDRVKKGQLIGYSGATGWLARLGPHLHFMVGKYGEGDGYETLEIVWDNQ